MAIINGKWEFKDLCPFTAPAENITQDVSFTTADGVVRTKIKILNDDVVILEIDGCTVAIYGSGRKFAWLDGYENYKTIDFGETEQEVSDEFYSLFTQIAVSLDAPQRSLADKLVLVAENQQRVYDAGYEAGQAAGGGSLGGLPTYETDITFVSKTNYAHITHNLNTKKFLVIGRVKEHDGNDLDTYKISQLVAWSPDAYFQNAQYNLANGGTYNPYEYFVEKIKNESGVRTVTGEFGADMKVSILNDGPVTIILETKDGNII